MATTESVNSYCKPYATHLERRGNDNYGVEAVTQLQHALKAPSWLKRRIVPLKPSVLQREDTLMLHNLG